MRRLVPRATKLPEEQEDHINCSIKDIWRNGLALEMETDAEEMETTALR
jgi:hypothetical protein